MPVAELLDQYDHKEALHALSRAARHLLPTPRDLPRDETAEMLLAAARLELHISPDDDSQKAKAKLVGLFNRVLTDRIMPPASVPEIAARLGSRGDLRPNQYNVKFVDDFKNRVEKKRGIKRDQVEAVLRRPDDWQHLMYVGSSLVSLFTKGGQRSNGDTYTTLVQAGRNGNTQFVQAVWRIYHSDVDLRKTQNPLSTLFAFVDVYGLDCIIGETRKRFYESERVFATSTGPTTFFQVHNPENHSVEASFFFKVTDTPLPMADVSIAYAIDLTKYMKDLRRHGETF